MVPFLLYLHRLEDLWYFQGFSYLIQSFLGYVLQWYDTVLFNTDILTSVDGWTLLSNMKCFPDGFDGPGNLHTKGWFELRFGEFMWGGDSTCG